MKFVIALLIASVAATRLEGINYACEQIIPVCGVPAKNVNVLLPGAERRGDYAKLTSESAGS